MDFMNSYEDRQRAEAYAKLEFAGTYYLAYRDLPEIFQAHVKGPRAVDFGCGTGRSTRFLRRFGYEAVGVDISEDMLKKAREADPGGDYRLVEDGTLGPLAARTWDLVLSVFTFDNIPTRQKKLRILETMRGLLNAGGRIVSVVSAPEIYRNEWVSFSTRDYPENRNARCGDKVRIIITDTDDARPVEDIIWPDSDYRQLFGEAGLEVVEMRRPLAGGHEPYAWVNETRIAPWSIYVLKRGK